MRTERQQLSDVAGVTLPERFTARAALTPASTAYRTDATSATWNELAHRAAAFGLGLAELGHHPGDTVAILGPTRPEWTICDIGAIGVGAVVAGIYPTLNHEGISYVLEHSGATTLVVAGPHELDQVLAVSNGVPRIERIIAWDEVDLSRDARVVTFESVVARGVATLVLDPDAFTRAGDRIAPSDPAFIVYTSGTTGPPKGAVLTHANVTAVMDQMNELFPMLGPDDTTIAFLPLAHVAGHVLEQYGRIQLGFSAFYCPDVKHIVDAFGDAKPTLFGSVPRVFEKVLARVDETIAHESRLKRSLARWALATGVSASRGRRERRREPRVRRAIAERIALRTIRGAFGGRCKLFIVGAAPVAFEVLEFCEGIGIPIYEVYGMTESSSLISANRPGACKLGTVGRVVPGGELVLGADGEVLFRGPNNFRGYLHNDEATAETLDADGWLHTGDIGEMDADGFLKIVDRKKDLIITAGGKNISPSNIENVLRQIPLVGEALVHGDRRKYLTAILSLDKDELQRFAAAAVLPIEQRLRDFLQHHVDLANAKLSHFEQIQRWTIAPEPFSIEDGTLTPTLKVKRKAVEAKYALLLNEMYTGEAAATSNAHS